MNNESHQPLDPGEDIELQILLHSTQELPSQEAALLAQSIATNAEAAAFSQFLTETLPLAAKAPRDFAALALGQTVAPRDFAAVAIEAAMGNEMPTKVVRFPNLRKYAVVAAVAAGVAVLAVPAILHRPPQKPNTNVAVAVSEPSPRITSNLTARLNALESELMEPSLRQPRVRHQRFNTL